MNPFVQKSLEKIHGFPSRSASILEGAETYQSPKDQDWMIEKNSKTGAIVVDDHMRVQLQSKSTKIGKDGKTTVPSARAYMTDVFALGDNANVRDHPMPATAQTASQQALWLGKHLNNNTTATQAFKFKNLGIMTYLGSSKGLLQTGGGKGGEGYLAWRVRRGQ